MNYQEFIYAVENAVRKLADGNVSVTVNKIRKNNNFERMGMVLTAKGINIAPTIYLEEFYQKYKSGLEMTDVAGQILCLYEKVKIGQSFEGNRILNYEYVKPRIVYKVIHKKKNEALLHDVPYIPFLDLAVVFYILLEIEGRGSASVLVQREYLNLWGKSEAEICQEAEKNSPLLLPAGFKTMKAMLREMLSKQNPEEEEEDYMYVLTNSSKNLGAACILYPGMLGEIRDKLKENYYILPSSIHEVIIIPESKSPGKEELKEMITEINRTQLEEEEVLSDQPYYYSSEKERLYL